VITAIVPVGGADLMGKDERGLPLLQNRDPFVHLYLQLAVQYRDQIEAGKGLGIQMQSLSAPDFKERSC